MKLMSGDSQLQEALVNGLQALTENGGLPTVTREEQARLLAFIALLAKWNKIHNLTAVRNPLHMVDRHLLDSLVLLRWLEPLSQPGEAVYDVMDIGTGAGLPVLPLAIVRPDLRFLSIESNGKKTRFQQQAVLELGLKNVTVLHQRVEHVTESAHMVMSRAFTAPIDFLSIAEPLCAPGGTVVIMLGRAERLPTHLGPGYELSALVEVDVPGADSARHIALCQRQHG